MIKQQLDQDIKTAMLSGDKRLVGVLRTIKSVILDKEVNSGARETGLDEAVVIDLLQKEQKKRLEAARLYESANDSERADQEKYEAEMLVKYLPKQLTEEELVAVVKEVISEMDGPTMQQMGQVIGAVKSKVGPAGDGAVIAKIVKENLV